MFQLLPEALKPALASRARGVKAVLGPTNTGKTHFAIERMLGHSDGIIGLPLRLLAREVYNRVVARVGAQHVALITGEEKIKPPKPRYWVATVEAMPRDLDVSFVAVDEIQLATNLDRGHVFTERLLNRRGAHETLVIGAETMRRVVEELLPGVEVVTRPRLSSLTFLGDRKLTRLPRRSAVVAFSAEEVYAIAELIRRQRGGAAVVLGALSPRTRNAQVAMYQAGEVDYIVATDAIGMGLNLDVDHVAFAGDRKFDGWQYRRLNPAEFGQIAGRAGRHVRDGTFGTTGRCPAFDEELVEALENHRFDPIATLQWRNSALDFDSIGALQASLDVLPTERALSRTPIGEDLMILEIAARDPDVVKAAKTRADVQRLWEACQIPDYRKLSPVAHAELVLTIFGFIVRAGRIPEEWFGRQIAMLDRVEGDIDALSARIAQVRTWTYIANRSDWMGDPEHWQGVTRQIEDSLSDALHERLAQRFVDRRTSVLMRRLRENAMLEAEVTTTGDVMVEGQHVGQLHGFRFTPDPLAAGEAARTLNAAAQKALASEIEARANKVNEAVDEAFVLANDGQIRWLGEAVGRIVAGDKLLEPRVRVLADDQLTGPFLESVQRRLDLWLQQHARKLLGALFTLEAGEGLGGIARGIGFQIAEALGVLERSRVSDELKSLEQPARADLRKMGVRFGAYHIYLPQLLKPAPRALAAQLWALNNGGAEGTKGLEEVPHLAASGRTSFKADKDVPKGLYRAAGFRVCGERAVRVDILERLADLIRPAINYRPGVSVGAPPPGTADRDGFLVTVGMTSLAGCSGEDFAPILRSLGYVVDRRKGPAITVPLIAAASTEPIKPARSEEASAADAPPADAQAADNIAAEGHAAGSTAAESTAAESTAAESHEAEGAVAESHGAESHGAESAAAESTAAESHEAENAVAESHGAESHGAESHAAESHAAESTAAESTAAESTATESHEEEGAVAESHGAERHAAELTASDAAQAERAEFEHDEFIPCSGLGEAPDLQAAGPAELGGEPRVGPGAPETAAVAEGVEQLVVPPSGLEAVVAAEAQMAAEAFASRQGAEGGTDAAAEEANPDGSRALPSADASGSAGSPTPAGIALAAEGKDAGGGAEARNGDAIGGETEEPLIDVWRPHRHHQAPQKRHPDRRPRDRGPARAPGPVPARNVPSQQEGTVEATVGIPAANENQPVPGREDRSAAAPRFRSGGGKDSANHHRARREGGEHGRWQHDRRPRSEDRREGRPGGDEHRSAAGAHKPAPRDRPPDPNSPFAKLAALKIELERKSRSDAAEGENAEKDPSR